MKKIILLFALITSFYSSVFSQKGKEMVLEMISEIHKLSTVQFLVTIKERINGELISSEGLVKAQFTPYKIYYKEVYPNKDLEISFDEMKDEQNAIVNMHSFPWLRLELSPFVSVMRKNRHYTIFELAIFKYMANTTGQFLSNNDKILLIKTDTINTLPKNQCMVSIYNPSFTYFSYSVLKNENSYSISKKFGINEYKLVDKNSHISNFDDVVEGKQILVPNSYAGKIIFIIDKHTMLPIKISIYDEVGLYEEYIFKNVLKNPIFEKNDFVL